MLRIVNTYILIVDTSVFTDDDDDDVADCTVHNRCSSSPDKIRNLSRQMMHLLRHVYRMCIFADTYIRVRIILYNLMWFSQSVHFVIVVSGVY